MLECNRFVVKEQIKILSSVQKYDILDGDSGVHVGTAQETIGFLVQALRWVVSKQLLPTHVEVRATPDNSLVFAIRRGIYLFRSRVEVLDSEGALMGYFKSKFFTISGGFHVYDKDDKHFAEVKGKMFGFDYRFRSPDGSVELGRVSKKWGGVMKEFFTSADSYGVEISPELAEQPMAKMLILAAVLAIDLIYKSESRTVDFPDIG